MCSLHEAREIHQREEITRLTAELAESGNQVRLRDRREWVFWAAILGLALLFAAAETRCI
jgi:hypothetical protein